jgi:TusA-related sulfurtransferase
MEEKQKDRLPEPEDLTGLVCPRPIAEIVQAVHALEVGASLRFLVDDPLALKAVPEELEEYGDLEIEVHEESGCWEITVTRTPSASGS